jgi:5-formyltetrahydrofolate cyclo-ligase
MTQAKKMGICFPFQMLKEIPTEDHDIKMDAIITIDNQRQTSESSVSN